MTAATTTISGQSPRRFSTSRRLAFLGGKSPANDEASLVASLKRGSEAAFSKLVGMLEPRLRRLARTLVPTGTMVDEVVQDTWLGVVEGIERFEGRSSLKTWIYRILHNRALTRRSREARSAPLSALGFSAGELEDCETCGARFKSDGSWDAPARPNVDQRLMEDESREKILEAMKTLPERQRKVMHLRDIEGRTSQEVREEMQISEGNQRVLLHRARQKVKKILDGDA